MELCEQGCTGCGVCVEVCPARCISWRETSWGEWVPKVEKEQCTGCGECIRRCPAGKTPLSMRPQTVYAAYSLDPEERRRCSSGGVATVVSRQVIREGGAVFGSAYERGGGASHRCVTDMVGLEALRGSKYMQSDLKDSYRRVHKLLLQDRNVLFIGAPCQVDGLYAYLENDFERLTTMDFVCHGAPAPRFFQEHLDYLEQKYAVCSDHVSFRGEYGYCLTLYREGIPFYRGERDEDLYYRAFLENLLTRDCCLQCPYASAARVADLTVGDFWGLGKEIPFSGDLSDGVSEILVNTRKGGRLLERCRAELYLEPRILEEAQRGNKQLQGPPLPHPMRESFRKRYCRMGFERAAAGCLHKDRWTQLLRKGFGFMAGEGKVK